MASTSLPVLPALSRDALGDTYGKFNACVHCGLCLPACPTYAVTMDEADSPRGRIHLMKAVVDGRIGPSPVVFEHLDRCLVCRACETACPSGVDYHALLEAVRPSVAGAALGRDKRMKSGMLQWVVGHVLPYPRRASVALGALALARKVGLGGLAEKMAPGSGAVADQVTLSPGAADRGFHPARGEHKGNVILLRGCVGSVVSGDVNAAAVRVLTQNGWDVHLLAHEPCCGAMAAHANDPAGARAFAMAMVDALEAKGGDYVVSPIAGCGAQLKSLHHVLADAGDYARRAKAVVARMRDITEFLLDVGITPPTGALHRTVTYHDPCHLAHAQRITEPPRQLLALIPGLQLIPLAESDLCCGAAGTYSMNQPAMADTLGRRKVDHILATGAAELVTANVGCALQIARHLRARGNAMRVRHVVELLAEAYGN